MPNEFFVYEAEYEIAPDGIKTDWTKPVPETVIWHGPFETQEQAKEVCRARYWSNIDKAYHRPVVVTSPDFDPTRPETHDLVCNADLYWDRRSS